MTTREDNETFEHRNLTRAEQAERSLAAALARMKEAQLQAIDQQSRRCAAETALASAREILERVVKHIGSATPGGPWISGFDIWHDAADWLSSHPAPVAARTFEHPGAEEVFNTLQATRKAPVAAPCAGCAELQARLDRVAQHLKPAGHDASDDYNLLCVRKALQVLREPCKP